MPVACPACGYDKNPDGAEFCDACGSELPLSKQVSESSLTPSIPAPIGGSTLEPNIPAPSVSYDASQSNFPVPSIPPANLEEIPSPPKKPEIPATAISEVSRTADNLMPHEDPHEDVTSAPASTARLLVKQPDAPVSEFLLEENTAVIGIFDPELGPVEIDLEGFRGDETVSRRHAEIYFDGSIWRIKDLDSLNGVFIKPAGQGRFSNRIEVPTILNSGDEVAIAKIRLLFQVP